MPPEFSGLHLHRDHREEVQVVSGSHLAAMLRNAVTSNEINEAEIGIGGTHQPDRTAAGLPRVVVLRPRLVARLSRTGNDIELPDLTSGLRIERNRLPPK